MIRELSVSMITDMVSAMCVEANKRLPSDILRSFRHCAGCETNNVARQIFSDMLLNSECAAEFDIPVCQDTGMAVIFAEIGQDIHFIGGDFTAAINEGVRRGYLNGRLRCSIVGDPLRRVNTGDNTPAVIHTSIVPGNGLTLTVAPKGFGSENMSALKMFTPAATREDIIEFVVRTVKNAGSNPCPPVVVGVGIGGDFEYSALLAKKALCRSIEQPNSEPYYASLEADMLKAINELGIGAQGFGGDITALACNIEYAPTHIAGLPVAVNMGCNITRHVTRSI